MSLASFETAGLVKLVYDLRHSTAAVCPQKQNPLQDFGYVPPPRNNDPVRQRIYAEDLQGFQIDQAIEEEYRNQRERAMHPSAFHGATPTAPTNQQQAKPNTLDNVPQLHTHYPCDPANLCPKSTSGIPMPDSPARQP